MTPFIIFTALAAMILLSAASACGPFQVPRLSWYRWFFLFLGSSFIGCLFEMGVVWLGTGVLMSRSSLLYGAVSVVWGLGALLMTVILFPLRRYGGWTGFLGGAILGGGFEYLASLLLERVYHRLFWDYSNLPLNLDGRTNLLYAVFWGLAGVVWIYRLVPYLLRQMDRISVQRGQAAAAGLAVLLTFDMVLSAAAFLRMEERSQGQMPGNRLEFMLDTWYDDDTMQKRYQNMTQPRSAPETVEDG